MTAISNQYKQQKDHILWQLFRKKVLKLHNYKCDNCGSTERLQIHHPYYEKNHDYWEYPIEDMKVLCQKCHYHVHFFHKEDKSNALEKRMYIIKAISLAHPMDISRLKHLYSKEFKDGFYKELNTLKKQTAIYLLKNEVYLKWCYYSTHK